MWAPRRGGAWKPRAVPYPRHPHTAIGRPQGIAPTWHPSGWGMGTEGCTVSSPPAHRHRATTRDRPYMAPVGVGHGTRGLRRILATRTLPSGDHKGSPLHGTRRGGAWEPRAAPYPRHPHAAIGLTTRDRPCMAPAGVGSPWDRGLLSVLPPKRVPTRTPPSGDHKGSPLHGTRRRGPRGSTPLTLDARARRGPSRGVSFWACGQASTSLILSCRGRPYSSAHSLAQRTRRRKSVVGRTARLLPEGRDVCPSLLRAPDPGQRFGRHS